MIAAFFHGIASLNLDSSKKKLYINTIIGYRDKNIIKVNQN